MLFLHCLKNFVISFSWKLTKNQKSNSHLYFTANPLSVKICGSQVMGQNALGQSNCRILNAISQERSDLDLDQHQIFWQVDTVVLWTGMPKVPKITSLQYFRIILIKKWGKNLFFWTTISFKVFYKLIPAIISHGQSIRNNKFPISLQCFKKEGRDEVDFSHANKH